jgi:energy-coupling factor transport system ATP-binding protein
MTEYSKTLSSQGESLYSGPLYSEPLYSLERLRFQYPEGEKLALCGIDLEVREGEFLALCGTSGCGKSTLLRHLKTALTPHGRHAGTVRFRGVLLKDLSLREQTARIGFVQQNPDNQIVTDMVWHELAFGLESLGYPSSIIRLRVAEMASFFGIQEWYRKPVSELSGGQRQLLNLAAVMTMQPDVLILDEPTSQLDPIASSDFLATLRKINSEIGTTIILSEHRLEEVLAIASRTLVMSDGTLVSQGSAQTVGRELKASCHPMLAAMPTPMRVYLALEGSIDGCEGGEGGDDGVGGVGNSDSGYCLGTVGVGKSDSGYCPVTVGEGRAFLRNRLPRGVPAVSAPPALVPDVQSSKPRESIVVSLKNVWFRYEREGRDVLQGLDLEVAQGELLGIVGGNGTGKTTALNVIAGLLRPYRGKVQILGEDLSKRGDDALLGKGVAVLPQDPQTLFKANTIREDLAEMLSGRGRQAEAERQAAIVSIAELTQIGDLLDMHPYDISGGEQQRVALAKVLLCEPTLLLMDEPTKGMDSFFKVSFAELLGDLRRRGLTVVMVSHDLEFCAHFASRCALFFDGGIVAQGEPHEFFSGNSFYTTAANRMSRNIIDGAITVEDVVRQCSA